MEFAEEDADDMNFTDSGGDFLLLPAAAGGHAMTERPSSSCRPRDVSQQLQPPRGRSRSRGRARGRSRSREHSRSKGRSNSRVPTVRNGVQQGNQHQTWASKIKSSQPQVMQKQKRNGEKKQRYSCTKAVGKSAFHLWQGHCAPRAEQWL
ncbi:hypothetical protein MRX96_016501 [Rhipicephalus microplus]